MKHVRLIDPATQEVAGHLPKRGERRRRTPSSAPVEHLQYDWFPIMVRSQKENLARLLLEDKGFATFVPTKQEYRFLNKFARAKQRKTLVAYAWMPGLVFVGMKSPYRWFDVESIAPFQSFISLGQDEFPRRMNHDKIYGLMKVFGRGRFVAPEEQKFMQTGQEFTEGDDVMVVGGPLDGSVLTVREINGRMARLFGEWFGAERGFDMALANLVKHE